ncbi:molybdenum-pterin binding domain-containing protein [Bacteroides luti]|jgi:molybdopterin-binding protein|uniref:Molybdenum-pterin binding domain-containing protein n=1 Tax=Bacteroides luti TaxID=1297750 RepID=A0A1M4YX98_9BACE|nr:TOBE domain-containing protein [Bacteroides luti]SHF09966.1 molybdenum-pterin binding domain-containing protein [Bacteroides luti]
MLLSARNTIKGKVIEIVPGIVTAKVKLDIGGGNTIVSVITVDSIGELNIKVGDEAYAIFKSTEVMIGI